MHVGRRELFSQEHRHSENFILIYASLINLGLYIVIIWRSQWWTDILFFICSYIMQTYTFYTCYIIKNERQIEQTFYYWRTRSDPSGGHTVFQFIVIWLMHINIITRLIKFSKNITIFVLRISNANMTMYKKVTHPGWSPQSLNNRTLVLNLQCIVLFTYYVVGLLCIYIYRPIIYS